MDRAGPGWDKKSLLPFKEIDFVRDLIALDLGPDLPVVELKLFVFSISLNAASDCDFVNATPEVTGSGSLSATT